MALALAVGAAALAWEGSRPRALVPEAGGPGVPASGAGPEADGGLPTALAPRGLRPADAAARNPRSDGEAAIPEAPAGEAPPPAGAVVAASFPALDPSTVEDRVRATSYAPTPVLRSDLVGFVGPYGVRDAPPAGLLRWDGVAQVRLLDWAGAEPPDETKDPATTAVRGTVVTEQGEPVAGAEVILYSSFYLRQAYYDHRVRQIGRARSDAEGVFELRPVELDTVHFGAGGSLLVTVRHAVLADVVAQPLSGVEPGRVSEVGSIVLPARSAVVWGVVRDHEGRAVAGAVVRASGALNPVEYDKTERMVVLDDCPSAVTDDEGRYRLTDFAGGEHEVSVHIRLDCPLHARGRWEGEREWSPTVIAGNAVRGRVVDPEGRPVSAAVVAGGMNWTPTNADGTFWLDNVLPGPLTLEVAHHAWHTVFVPGVATNGDDVTLGFERPLARVTLRAADAAGAPVRLVAVDWAWPSGGGPGRFAPDSRYWNDAGGVFRLTVPENAVGATVSGPSGASATLAAADLEDGTDRSVVLAPPASAR